MIIILHLNYAQIKTEISFLPCTLQFCSTNSCENKIVSTGNVVSSQVRIRASKSFRYISKCVTCELNTFQFFSMGVCVEMGKTIGLEWKTFAIFELHKKDVAGMR